VDCGEKKAHRGRIDWSPGKCFAFPLNKIQSDEASYLCVIFDPTCNFFLEYDPRFSVARFSTKSSGTTREPPTHRNFHKRYNAVLSFRTTRLRVPLALHPSPLQYPTLYVRVYSVRSLLRQPRCALEAGPSEAHAISFVHTPRPHLHRKGCTLSFVFFPPLPKE